MSIKQKCRNSLKLRHLQIFEVFVYSFYRVLHAERRKTDELLAVVKSAFRAKLKLSYQELCDVLMREMEIKDRTAKKYIAYMKEQRILSQDTSGNYQKGELCHT